MVQPAISNYITAGVYSRVFDLLNNPFTIIFLIYNLSLLIPSIVVYGIIYVVISVLSFVIGYHTVTTAYSSTLTVKYDRWNWETKVDDDSFELYEYIYENIANPGLTYENGNFGSQYWPSILSQNVGLKGYVPGISITFSAQKYRLALDSSTEEYYENADIVSLMYPDKRYADDDSSSSETDYSTLVDLVQRYESEYIVINNTLAVWDERGWYAKPYQTLIDLGLCTLEYENDSWVLLKMTDDWEHSPKNSERYWVHKYEYEWEQ